MNDPARVLVVGRSPSVLAAAVEMIRNRGHLADATNQFDEVLADYDVGDLDVLVFGGMVPADTKERLREEIARRNPAVTFVQGLVGIPGVIAAQVDGTIAGPLTEAELTYDATRRILRVDLSEPERVRVEALWMTSWRPPEPTSTSITLYDGELAVGPQEFPVPAGVPDEASYAAVRVGSRVGVLTVGPIPAVVRQLAPASGADQRLPDVAPFTTRGGVLPQM